MTFKQLNRSFILYYFQSYIFISACLFYMGERKWLVYLSPLLTMAVVYFIYRDYLKENNAILNHKQKWISGISLATTHVVAKWGMMLFLLVFWIKDGRAELLQSVLNLKVFVIYLITWLINVLLAFGILNWLENQHLAQQKGEL